MLQDRQVVAAMEATQGLEDWCMDEKHPKKMVKIERWNGFSYGI